MFYWIWLEVNIMVPISGAFSNILQCLVQPIISENTLQSLPESPQNELVERTAESAISLASGSLPGILLCTKYFPIVVKLPGY